MTLTRNRDGYPYRLRLDLLGEYQRKNLATVATALDILHEYTPLTISRRAFVEGVRNVATLTSFCGRWQVLSQQPLIVCDSAHNEHGAVEIGKQLKHRTNGGKLLCVMGFCDDKDYRKMLDLMPKDAHYILTEAAIARAASVSKVAEVATSLGLDFEVAGSVEEALVKAKSQLSDDDMLFIGGSSYIVAEVLSSTI